MKSKRSRTYLVSGLTLALIFVAIILVFRDVLPDIVKDLSTVPFWGVLLLLALGFAYEVMESVLCLVIIHHKKPDCTFIDALRVTFLGVFGNITTLGAGTLPMQSFYLYRRGLDAGSGLGIMASEYVLHKISVLICATVALLLGGDWLEQSASGLARYLLIGYVIGALIVIALTLLYTWDRVLKLVLLLLALGFAYEVMESVLCLVIIHHKKPDCTFIDALRVTFLGVFGNITTLGAGTLPMQSFYLYRRGLDAGSGLGIMASEYVLHKISVLICATVALLLGGDWLEQSASGLARYLLIGYVIGALIVIALMLLYTWDKVLKLVLMLLGKLPHTPKWDERREEWANSLTELNREAKKVLLVPSIRVKGIAVSLVKLFVLYSIPYAALRLVGCTALNFAQAQLLASLMLLITSALPNVAGVGPMEFAFLLLFAPWADTAIASSALVLYRVATYFFPFLLSVIVFLREEKKSLKGFDAQSA